MTRPRKAFYFDRDNPDCYIEKHQEAACKSPDSAYLFALDVPGANIEYCQEHSCKDPYYALKFAENIQEADIEYCYKFSKTCDRKRAIYNIAWCAMMGGGIKNTKKAPMNSKEKETGDIELDKDYKF